MDWNKWWIKWVYIIGSQIKIKTPMLGSSLYDYSNAYILVKGTITVPNTGTVAAANIRKKKGISKNCKDTDVVMPMYNLKKHLEDYGYGFIMLWCSWWSWWCII